MKQQILRRAIFLGALLGFSATAAVAQEVSFNGSMTGTALGALAPECAPLPRRSNLTGDGTSSLGDFDYSHSVCLAGVGPIHGSFFFDLFGGDTLQGTVDGAAVANATPGLFDIVLGYNILGGTGQFLGATGAFQGIGTVDQRNLPTTRVSINFSAVPEPSTWAMMLLGFGAMGLSVRRSRGTHATLRALA